MAVHAPIEQNVCPTGFLSAEPCNETECGANDKERSCDFLVE